MKDLKLALRLTADAKGFVGEVRLSKKELEGLTQATKKTAGATKSQTSSTKQATAANNAHARSAQKAAAANMKASQSFSAVQNNAKSYFLSLVGAAAMVQLTRLTIATADSFTELNNRLRMVTDSEQGLTFAREQLLKISQKTRTEFAANAQFYGRVALASSDLSHSSQDLLRVTELLNMQLQIGGTNAREGAMGLIQFSQGLAANRLQGDELRSVLENLQGVQQGLLIGFAKMRRQGQIDFDVTRQNIRKLASEGVLTADLILSAVLASADDTEAKFERVAVTMSGGFIRVGNALKNLIGELDDNAISADIAASLTTIAEAIDDIDTDELRGDLEAVGNVVEVLAYAIGVRLALATLAYTAASVKAAAASVSFTASNTAALRSVVKLNAGLNLSDKNLRRTAASMAFATNAGKLLGAGLRVLTGPVGWVLLAAYAIYEFATTSNRAAADVDVLTAANKALNESFADLGKNQVKKRLSEIRPLIDATIAEISRIEDKLAKGTKRAVVTRNDGPYRGRKIMTDVPLTAADKIELGAQGEIAGRRLRELQQRRQDLQSHQNKLQNEAHSSGSDASAEFIKLQNELRTAIEKANSAYEARKEIIENEQNVSPSIQADMLARAAAERDAAIAAATRKSSKQDPVARAEASLKRQIALTGEVTQVERVRYQIASGALGKLKDGEDKRLLALAAQIDAEKAATEAAEQHADAVASIGTAVVALKSPYAQAEAAAAAWRKETLDGLDKTADGYNKLAAKVEEVYRERIARAQAEAAAAAKEKAAEQLAASTRWQDGVTRGLDAYAAKAANVAGEVESAITQGLDSMTQGLADFVTTGELQFKRFAQSVLNDIARITIQSNITGPLAGFLGSAIGGMVAGFGGGGAVGANPHGFSSSGNFLAGAGAYLKHSGGIAGQGNTRRLLAPNVAADVFANAPRLHRGGIAGDEVPAILRRGEEVLPAQHPRHRNNAGGGDSVVINQSFDFRNADETSIGRLRAEAQRIKDEAKQEVVEYLSNTRRGRAVTGRG